MRRPLNFDRRMVSIVGIIFVLALAAVSYSNIFNNSNSIWNERSRECSLARKENSGRTPKECKDIVSLTLDDPVALYTLVLTVATVLLFVATVGLWDMARRQSRDTKEAIAASQDANNISRQSLELNQRPWVGFEHLGPSEVSLHANILSFRLPVTVHNFGTGPAVSLHYGCVIYKSEGGAEYLKELHYLSKIAMENVAKTPSNPVTIFPNQSHALERVVAIEFDRADIDRRNINLFANYYIILTYKHAETGKAYCTATGFSFMHLACPTYSDEVYTFTDPWPVHMMPGANFIV